LYAVLTQIRLVSSRWTCGETDLRRKGLRWEGLRRKGLRWQGLRRSSRVEKSCSPNQLARVTVTCSYWPHFKSI